MNPQVASALNKQKHPEQYCKEPKCLWRIMKLNHETQTYYLLPDCGEGRCPKHYARLITYWQRIGAI